jgi:phage terminase large subunit-like protein
VPGLSLFGDDCVEFDPKELPQGYEQWPDHIKKYFIDQINQRRPKPPRTWYSMARPKQLAPDNPNHCFPDKNGYRCQWGDGKGRLVNCTGQDDWFMWLFMCGRGYGKTLAGANWIIEQSLTYPQTRWAVVAPTYDQVQNVCFASVDSGIRAQAQPGEIVDYNKNNMLLTMSNGSEIKGFSAETPERIRGWNLAGAWLDEVGSFRNREIWDEVLEPALRKGNPRVIVTTTPRNSPLLKEWYERWHKAFETGAPCDIHLTNAHFEENDTLPPARVAALKAQYGSTRVGRQELAGEMLEDFEGALWKREFIDDARVREEDFFTATRLDPSKFNRLVVGFDPSMTSGDRADEHGIVVCGQGTDGDGYLIADWSANGTPDEAARRAVAAYYDFYADCIVTEANQAGDWLISGIRAIDPNVPVRLVRATKGKFLRAQPISMLAEQGRLHHIGFFKKLEDQLCMLAPDSDKNRHDDRADAMIWAMTELRGITEGSYLEAYGFKYCNSCGKAFRKMFSKCPACGHVQEDDAAPRPAQAGKWANAYLKTCKDCGGQYLIREKECPKCHPSPGAYLAQVQRLTGNQGWLPVNPQNPFHGRKL